MSKTVYSKDQLSVIGDLMKSVRPSPEELERYAIITETASSWSAASSAPSASSSLLSSKRDKRSSAATPNTSRGDGDNATELSAASRFAADQKWDRGNDRGNARSEQPRDARTWRGGRDKETFEEGYLYELQQTAKHKQVLRSAVVEYERKQEDQKRQEEMKKLETLRKTIESKKLVEGDAPTEDGEMVPRVQGSGPGTDELEAMFSKLRSADEDVPAPPPRDEIISKGDGGKRASRFFSGADDAPPAALGTSAAPSSNGAAKPGATFVDPLDLFATPSSNVVWNKQTAALVAPTKSNNNQQPSKAEAPPAAPFVVTGSRQNASATRPPHPTLAASPLPPTITVGQVPAGNKTPSKSGGQRVWSAADLESQLLGKQPATEAAPPRPHTTNKGVFDASQLESQLMKAPTTQPTPNAQPAPLHPGVLPTPVAASTNPSAAPPQPMIGSAQGPPPLSPSQLEAFSQMQRVVPQSQPMPVQQRPLPGQQPTNPQMYFAAPVSQHVHNAMTMQQLPQGLPSQQQPFRVAAGVPQPNVMFSVPQPGSMGIPMQQQFRSQQQQPPQQGQPHQLQTMYAAGGLAPAGMMHPGVLGQAPPLHAAAGKHPHQFFVAQPGQQLPAGFPMNAGARPMPMPNMFMGMPQGMPQGYPQKPPAGMQPGR